MIYRIFVEKKDNVQARQEAEDICGCQENGRTDSSRAASRKEI